LPVSGSDIESMAKRVGEGLGVKKKKAGRKKKKT